MRRARFVQDRLFAEPERFEPNSILHRCTFTAGGDGAIFEGAFHACGFAGFDWYQPFFHAVFIDTAFQAMILRGASFSGCRLVGCTFENTLFARDDLDGACDFEGCSFTDCTFVGCEVDAGDQQPFGKNRWYGCTQIGCRGFEGLF